MPVAVVTDSATGLPAELTNQLSLTTVPLHVYIAGREQLGADGNQEVLAALRNREQVTTSGPAIGEVADAYRRLVAAGFEEVISLHMSSRLSGTYDHARQAAHQLRQEMPEVAIEVIDTKTVALGVGFVALACARAADMGATLTQAVSIASTAQQHTHLFFGVTDLGHLRRSGRLSGVSALAGSALSVKPLLTIRGGDVAIVERVRTLHRLRARLVERAVNAVLEANAVGEVLVGIQHVGAGESAQELAEELQTELAAEGIESEPPVIAEVSPAVAVHTGPGTLGVVITATTDGAVSQSW